MNHHYHQFSRLFFFLLGCDQESRHSQDPVVTVVSEEGTQMDCSFVKDAFMDATDIVVKRALEGLDDSTLGDTKRRIMLENISQTLPTQVPEVARVQAMLVELIALSNKLETGQTEFTKGSERDEHVATEVELKIKSGHNVSKATIEDLSALDKKCTETEAEEAALKVQLEEVTATLHKLKREREQRRQAHDAHQSELKNLVKSLQDTNAGKRTRLAEFEQKKTALKTEASQLLNSLQNWRAP
jgi:chromosome segregation ATPase